MGLAGVGQRSRYRLGHSALHPGGWRQLPDRFLAQAGGISMTEIFSDAAIILLVYMVGMFLIGLRPGTTA